MPASGLPFDDIRNLIANMPGPALQCYTASEQRAVVRQVDPGSGITGIHTRYWVVMYPGGYRFTATFDSAINFANDKIKEIRA